MRGQHMKISRVSVEDSGSKPRLTTPDKGTHDDWAEPLEYMGMIWQDEIIKDRRKREWWAFYAGCVVGATILIFSYLFLMRLAGGVCS